LGREDPGDDDPRAAPQRGWARPRGNLLGRRPGRRATHGSVSERSRPEPVRVRGRLGAGVLGSVSSYYGFREETSSPMVRREGPGRDIVVIVSFGEQWTIDGQRLASFAAGLRDRQVRTRHEGRSSGIHVNLSPPAAYRVFGLPLHTLADRQVPLEDVLGEPFLAERLHEAGGWDDRFLLLD